MSVLPITHGETVQHIRWTGQTTDAQGYRTSGYAPAVDVPNVGVDVVADSTEPRDGTVQRADADLTLFLPPGTTVGSRDKFIVRGETYQAEGIGVPLNNFFTGSMFNTEVKVKRTNA